MPLPSTTFRSELPPVVRKELDQFDSELTGYLLLEHDDDGRHTQIPTSILTGTVADAQLSPNVALKNINNQFSTDQTITGNLVLSGAIVERSRPAFMGDWQPYTVQFKNHDGTVMTIGDGVLSGRYSLIGRTCHAHVLLYIGSTTVVPAGIFGVTLPLPWVGGHSLGSVFMYGPSGKSYLGSAVIGQFFYGPLTNCAAMLVGSLGGSVYDYALMAQTGVPFPWVTGVFAGLQLTYEV